MRLFEQRKPKAIRHFPGKTAMVLAVLLLTLPGSPENALSALRLDLPGPAADR